MQYFFGKENIQEVAAMFVCQRAINEAFFFFWYCSLLFRIAHAFSLFFVFFFSSLLCEFHI